MTAPEPQPISFFYSEKMIIVFCVLLLNGALISTTYSNLLNFEFILDT